MEPAQPCHQLAVEPEIHSGSWSLYLSNEGIGPSLWFSSLKAFSFFFFLSHNSVSQMNLIEQLNTLK